MSELPNQTEKSALLLFQGVAAGLVPALLKKVLT